MEMAENKLEKVKGTIFRDLTSGAAHYVAENVKYLSVKKSVVPCELDGCTKFHVTFVYNRDMKTADYYIDNKTCEVAVKRLYA